MTDRSKTLEVMARAAHAAQNNAPYPWWHEDAQKCALAKHVAESILTALQAEGMAVVPGWQPIETRPAGMKATHLLCNAKGQVAPCVRGIIHVDDGESVWDWDYGEAATHWQPLPASPYGKAAVKEKDDE